MFHKVFLEVHDVSFYSLLHSTFSAHRKHRSAQNLAEYLTAEENTERIVTQKLNQSLTSSGTNDMRVREEKRHVKW
jgi:ubiquinone biosynthesis protein UbiJ